jgi:hypothetical protein
MFHAARALSTGCVPCAVSGVPRHVGILALLGQEFARTLHGRIVERRASPPHFVCPAGVASLRLQADVLVPVGVMEDAPAFDAGDPDGVHGGDLLDPEEPDLAGTGRRLGTVVKLQTLLHENARLVQVCEPAAA